MVLGFNDILHFIAIFQLLILTFVLVKKGGKRISNLQLAFFFIAQILVSLQAIYWEHYEYFLYHYPHLAHVAIPFIFLWGPTMYLYVKSETTSNFKFKWIHFDHFVIFLTAIVYLMISFYTRSGTAKILLLGNQNSSFILISQVWMHYIMIVQVFVYNVAGIWSVRKYESAFKTISPAERNKIIWVKSILYGYFIACMLHIGNTLLEGVVNNRSQTFLIDYVIFFIYYTYIIYQSLIHSPLGEIHRNTNKTRVLTMSDSQAKQLVVKLDSFMMKEKPFLNFEITLKTILEIIYESGFNSKTAFNVAFKKYTCQTPTQYRNSLQ